VNYNVSSFPKIFALGTRYVKDLFSEEVEVTEKLDGSQFGFGRVEGKLRVRSRGKEMLLDAPDKLFEEGVRYVQSIRDWLPGSIHR